MSKLACLDAIPRPGSMEQTVSRSDVWTSGGKDKKGEAWRCGDFRQIPVIYRGVHAATKSARDGQEPKTRTCRSNMSSVCRIINVDVDLKTCLETFSTYL